MHIRKPILGRVIVLIAVLVGVVAPSAAPPALASTTTGPNLITNGCFNLPNITPGDYEPIAAPSTRIPGWTLGVGGVDLVAAGDWKAGPGCVQSVALVAYAPSSVTQTVKTSPGASYLLRWEATGDPSCAPVVKKMDVFWGGRLVDAPSFNTAGHTKASIGWVAQGVTVTSTGTRSVVKFADASTPVSNCGAAVDGVSLTAAPETVNGFTATGTNDPYSVAERQMLAKLPGHTVVPSTGTSVFALQAVAANQVQNGAALQIVWTIAPSAAFVHETSAARLAGAKLVEQYLTGLLTNSKDLYLAALQADRVPLQGTADLATWWGVLV